MLAAQNRGSKTTLFFDTDYPTDRLTNLPYGDLDRLLSLYAVFPEQVKSRGCRKGRWYPQNEENTDN